MSKSEKYKGPTKFGEVLAPGGAMFVIRTWRDVAYAQLEAVRAKMIMNGMPITPLVERLLVEHAEKMATELENEYRAKGVPNVFKKLLALEKKKDVIKFLNSMKITGSEFALFIHNCAQVGLNHSRQHLQVIPKELHSTESERKAFEANGVGPFKTVGAKKFVKKMMATFEQRKNINAHLFEVGDQWHLFWFTFDDSHAEARGRSNHWAGGDHVHYTSYLWNHDKNELWSKFSNPPYTISGVHIKYDHEAE